MTNVVHTCGVDPGLVDIGCVRMLFLPDEELVTIVPAVFKGAAAVHAGAWAAQMIQYTRPKVFIEGYRPRGNLSSDKEMGEQVDLLRRESRGTVLLNTGVKKVIRRPFMELLEVWSFKTKTHHQDLRSAARIGLFGMAKDPVMNQLLADIIAAHLKGKPWKVIHA